MAESDLVLTDIDLDDTTILKFINACHSGAPVRWDEKLWRVNSFHNSGKLTARYTFKLVQVPPDEANP